MDKQEAIPHKYSSQEKGQTTRIRSSQIDFISQNLLMMRKIMVIPLFI